MKLQLSASSWDSKQLCPQSVMQPNHLSNGRRWNTPKKTAERCLIRKLLQSDQRQKQSIVLENLGLVDALDAGDQYIEERHNEVLGTIVDPVGRGFENALEPATQAELVTKSLNQEQPTEMRQGVALERKLQCLQAFRHSRDARKGKFRLVSQSSHLVKVVTPPGSSVFCPKTRVYSLISGAEDAFFRFNGEEDIWFVRAELPIVASITPVGNAAHISWNAVPGGNYCVQALWDLTLPWSMATNVACVASGGSTASVNDPLAGSGPPRFYRVARQ